MVKEITKFAYWGERTYASALYDFAREIIIKIKLNNKPTDCDLWLIATEEINKIATKVNNNWEETIDSFDFFTLSELEEFLEIGFELICHPTYDCLNQLDTNEKLLIEMRFAISVGLFIKYEKLNSCN